jgi:hypothetical protein
LDEASQIFGERENQVACAFKGRTREGRKMKAIFTGEQK